jgi:hypothetical protein
MVPLYKTTLRCGQQDNDLPSYSCSIEVTHFQDDSEHRHHLEWHFVTVGCEKYII